jgi:tRNA (pseudouridine54-N1)-methyltransferase
MRRFVVIGQRATSAPGFSLADLPSTSGRLDVLLRCLRAGLLVSHGLRRDTCVYLVLLGTPDRPRTVRVDGASAKFVRPDERSLGVLIQKSLGSDTRSAASPGTFVEVRPGIAIAESGLDAVLTDVGPSTLYVLEAGGADLRDAPLALDDVTFFLGDHLGFDGETRAALAAAGALPVGVGPRDIHTDDVVAIVSNEIDRRDALPPAGGEIRDAMRNFIAYCNEH